MPAIPIDHIELDGSTQVRERLDLEVCAEYAQAIREKTRFPPVVVFFDGGCYWLADGFHRVVATQQAGQLKIDCEIKEGTQRDAVLYAVGANGQHGLRRTNKDKNKAVTLLLNDPEWSQWSNREIARRAKVSPGLVDRLRNESSAHNRQIEFEKQTTRTITRNGKTYMMNVSNIGQPTRTSPTETEMLSVPPVAPFASSTPLDCESSGRYVCTDIRYANLKQLGGQRFKAIIADPPWEFERWAETGSVKTSYCLLGLEDICNLPIKHLADPDCILCLWATNPHLQEALAVIESWGFTYKTKFPWIKTTTKNHQLVYGIGYWVRGVSEDIIIATRGNVTAPRLEGYLGLIGPNVEHSRKPQDIHTIAEKTVPGPYLELFARYRRPGWVCVGNECRGRQPPDPKPLPSPPWLSISRS